jgi:hypothetical protein
MNLGVMRQIARVQCYIHHVKGVEVQIKMPENRQQLTLLKIALQSATKYLK